MATKTLPKTNWQNLSFYSGFDYMRLIASGHVSIPASTNTNIVLPTGTYTPFIEVYFKEQSSGNIFPAVGYFIIGTDYKVNNGILTIRPSTTLSDAYYFVYRSNA